MAISIRPMRDGEHAFCERVLRALPQWFGIEESLVQYVNDTQSLPTWIAERDDNAAGFVTVREHNPQAAEIHCIAVMPAAHRHGVGRAMMSFIEHDLHSRGFRFLQVKTLGPSRPCAEYELTRRFYLALGFTPLEEFPTLWPGNPCLLFVKSLL